MKNSRRCLLKALYVGGSAVTVAHLPATWSRPVVESVVLPAHAQTTGSVVLPAHVQTTGNEDDDNVDSNDPILCQSSVLPPPFPAVSGCGTVTEIQYSHWRVTLTNGGCNIESLGDSLPSPQLCDFRLYLSRSATYNIAFAGLQYWNAAWVNLGQVNTGCGTPVSDDVSVSNLSVCGNISVRVSVTIDADGSIVPGPLIAEVV